MLPLCLFFAQNFKTSEKMLQNFFFELRLGPTNPPTTLQSLWSMFWHKKKFFTTIFHGALGFALLLTEVYFLKKNIVFLSFLFIISQKRVLWIFFFFQFGIRYMHFRTTLVFLNAFNHLETPRDNFLSGHFDQIILFLYKKNWKKSKK